MTGTGATDTDAQSGAAQRGAAQPSASRAVGFVGLGSIGLPMARRLLAWPGGLWVYDVAPEPVRELAGEGARAAPDLAALAREVDAVAVMVRDDAQVREVVAELCASAGHPLTVVVHSTIAPDTAEGLAELARPAGVRVLDAPVSGGAMGAAEGNLAVMVGGEDQAVADCRGWLELLGRVVHAGATGDGTRMKLARNLVHFVSFTAVTEAQRLAEQCGLDLVALGEVVRHTDAITGGPGAIMHRDTTAPLDPDEGWYAILDHVRQLGEKDLTLATELADSLGVDVPLARESLARLGPGLGLPRPEPASEQ